MSPVCKKAARGTAQNIADHEHAGCNIAQISCTFDNYVQHLITFLCSWCTGHLVTTLVSNVRIACSTDC